MMMPIYSGEFANRKGEQFKVVILKESSITSSIIGELTFPDEEPVIIEWNESSKENVISGSTATIKIISPGDRTYENLYTIVPGQIRCDIYRDENLYWKGCLDPEFYEEPYTDNEDYPVELTFSDFGILERLKYNLTGLQSIENILIDALSRAQIEEKINEDWISTRFDVDTAMKLSDISIDSGNFIDEDGEINSLKEVIEGILQPLALKMIQREGIVYIYDLNGIYNSSTEKIEWESDDQIMGTDKVANNVVVTFSPYASADIMNGKCEFNDRHSSDQVNLTNNLPSDGEYYSYYPDYKSPSQNSGWDYNDIAFTIHRGSDGQGLAAIPYGGYFYIQPQYGGNEATGAIWGFRTGGHGDMKSGIPKLIGYSPTIKSKYVVMQTNRVFIPYLTEGQSKLFYLKTCVEMLCDPRYNPFTSGEDEGNESSNYSSIKEDWSYVYIPVTVTLYDKSGNAIMYYDNSEIASKNENTTRRFYETKGSWKSGGETYGACWLEYYDPNDRKHSTGVMDWKKNRQNIGLTNSELFPSFIAMDDGQYIPYPPCSGYIEIKVYSGIWVYTDLYTDALKLGGDMDNRCDDQLKNIRWLLYKAPTIEMVKSSICNTKVESDDIEYKGYINKYARDDISIDTICGTMKNICPSARGVLRKTSTGEQITNMYRSGRTNQIERLLIGTLYSQFASRKTKLSGTVSLLKGFNLYTEGAQVETKKFLMLSDVQNIGDGISEIEIVELRPDEYDAIESD